MAEEKVEQVEQQEASKEEEVATEAANVAADAQVPADAADIDAAELLETVARLEACLLYTSRCV